MTIETPAHVECFGFVYHCHGSNIPVTGRTADAFGHVDAVIEVDKFWQVVYFVPLHGLVFGITVADVRELGALGQNLRVTSHTGLGRRDVCIARNLDTRVAITTIQLQPAHMQLVTVATCTGDVACWLDLRMGYTDIPNPVGTRVIPPRCGEQREDHWDPYEDT